MTRVSRFLACVNQRVSGPSSDNEILAGLGRAIRTRRLEMDMSQEALANLSGVDRSHMGKIERGERNVTLLNIERVAKVLDRLPSQLLIDAGF